MGLAAKNAILVIEFAEQAEKRGARVIDAALEAARLRLRPILMTSLAFIFGVLPLAIATGAGAGGQNAIGRSVVGGMFSATVLAIFLVPSFFVVVSRLFGHGKDDEGDQNVNNYEPLRDDGDDGDAGRDRGPTPQGA